MRLMCPDRSAFFPCLAQLTEQLPERGNGCERWRWPGPSDGWRDVAVAGEIAKEAHVPSALHRADPAAQSLRTGHTHLDRRAVELSALVGGQVDLNRFADHLGHE